jgi:hypothetical protein
MGYAAGKRRAPAPARVTGRPAPSSDRRRRHGPHSSPAPACRVGGHPIYGAIWPKQHPALHWKSSEDGHGEYADGSQRAGKCPAAATRPAW